MSRVHRHVLLLLGGTVFLVVTLFPQPAPFAEGQSSKVLKFGDKGQEVKNLQQRLNRQTPTRLPYSLQAQL